MYFERRPARTSSTSARCCACEGGWMCRSRASLRRADRLRSVSLSAGWLCWRAAVVMASLHLHHTPTVAVQPAYSVAKLASADCLTAYRRKRTMPVT